MFTLTNTIINMEVWKDVKNYKGNYMVSNLGNIKSLKRSLVRKNGSPTHISEKILKTNFDTGGYLLVTLSKENKRKTRTVHQLVAEAFLNHTPNGHKLVIDHINGIKTDNRSVNLRLVEPRVNTNKKHLKSTSKYTGVSWIKSAKKWRTSIHLNGKTKHIGYFKDELKAHYAYKEFLESLTIKTK